MRTKGRTDRTKLIVAFRNFSDTPNKRFTVLDFYSIYTNKTKSDQYATGLGMQCELIRVHKPRSCETETYFVRRLNQSQDPNYLYEHREASESTTELVTGWLHKSAKLKVIF